MERFAFFSLLHLLISYHISEPFLIYCFSLLYFFTRNLYSLTSLTQKDDYIFLFFFWFSSYFLYLVFHSRLLISYPTDGWGGPIFKLPLPEAIALFQLYTLSNNRFKHNTVLFIRRYLVAIINLQYLYDFHRGTHK